MVHPKEKWNGVVVASTGGKESDQFSSEQMRESLDVYLSGKSGILFESLARFAGPIFDFYEVDWRSGSVRTRDRDELTTMVAVLDAARLLWAFFSLDEEESVTHLPELEDAMLGPSADDEERSNLLLLLSLLEEHWQTFTPEDRRQAEAIPGYTLPDFQTLLAEFAGTSAPPLPEPRYGPDRLDLPEALALFAEPMLQEIPGKDHPDLLEERIARAQAYWELAQVPDEHFQAELTRLKEELSSPEMTASEIQSEALRMVDRYRRLFTG